MMDIIQDKTMKYIILESKICNSGSVLCELEDQVYRLDMWLVVRLPTR